MKPGGEVKIVRCSILKVVGGLIIIYANLEFESTCHEQPSIVSVSPDYLSMHVGRSAPSLLRLRTKENSTISVAQDTRFCVKSHKICDYCWHRWITPGCGIVQQSRRSRRPYHGIAYVVSRFSSDCSESEVVLS